MRITPWVVVLALVVGVRVARADDKAAAEAQFVKAKQLMKDGQTADACAAFAKSQDLDPQLGTRYNLGLCYEQLGKTASAWLIYRDLAQLDTNAKRKKDSKKRAASLEPRLCKLLIQASGGVRVMRDGVDASSLIGVEDPVDPGRYHVSAEADGFEGWATDVDATEGATVTVEVPALTPIAVVETADPITPVATTKPVGRGRRIAGLAVGGVGVISTVVGLVFGGEASSKWSEAMTLCGDDLSCETTEQYDDGKRAAADARAAGNLSTVFVGVGVVALAAGAIVYLTAPHGSVEVAPTVGGGAVGVTAMGRF
jgi:hypothetical protein